MDRSAQAPERVVGAAELQQTNTELEAGLHIGGMFGQGPPQVLRGLRKLALIHQDDGRAVVCVRMIGRDGERLRICGSGLAQIASRVVNSAELDRQYR